MAERILCQPHDVANVDNLIDNNFRKAMTVLILTINEIEKYEEEVGVFRYCYAVLKMKKALGELVKNKSGSCIQVRGSPTAHNWELKTKTQQCVTLRSPIVVACTNFSPLITKFSDSFIVSSQPLQQRWKLPFRVTEE